MLKQRSKKICCLFSVLFMLFLWNLPGSAAASVEPLSVPLPTSADAVHLFFDLINEKRVRDAVHMMDEKMVPNEQVAQAWVDTFSILSEVRVKRILQWDTAGWSSSCHRFKVTLQVTRTKGSPFRGWENGINTRWLTMQRFGHLWKIHEIATGP